MISTQPRLLKRYVGIARLLLRHGGRDWLNPAAKMELSQQGVDCDAEDTSSDLAADLEAMGPAFVKIGQMLASRPDIVPPEQLKALHGLCANVGPFDSTQAKEIVRAELGAGVSTLFAEFDDKPMAAASLSQVHRALLRDGREVAVKIQRPDIQQQIIDDLDAWQEIANLAERHSDAARCLQVASVIEEFRRTLMLELDFGNERRNLEQFCSMLADYPRLIIPKPINDYCSSRVLTMDLIKGTDITVLNPVFRTELDGNALAHEFFDAYLYQVLVAGCFHADPHPGNLLLTADHRIAILDLGMVGRLHKTEQRELLKLLLAIADGDGSRVAEIATGLGTQSHRFEKIQFHRRINELVARNEGVAIGSLKVGEIVILICKIATDCGLLLPPNLALLGKTLMQLDEVGSVLDPSFDPHAAIRTSATRIMRERMDRDSLPGQLYSTMIETREFVEKAPRQVSEVLDKLSQNQMRIRVDAFDQNALIGSIQKIANRITAGLVLAALIIGAALLMRVPTQFTVLGYPGLAMVLFLAAAGGGFWLAFRILADNGAPDEP